MLTVPLREVLPTAGHGGCSSARLERQVVVLEVGGSSPLSHPTGRDGGPPRRALGSANDPGLRTDLVGTLAAPRASSSIGRASDS